jgi:hypothetical protein
VNFFIVSAAKNRNQFVNVEASALRAFRTSTAARPVDTAALPVGEDSNDKAYHGEFWRVTTAGGRLGQSNEI